MSEHTFKHLILHDDVYCDSVEVTDENGFRVIDVNSTAILLGWDVKLGIAHWADDPRASLDLTEEQQQANARRIVACVNACTGFRTESLEKAASIRVPEWKEIEAQRDQVLRELEAAHLIIRNALNLMTTEQKLAWGERNATDGVEGEGVTRANERAAVIAAVKGGAA